MGNSSAMDSVATQHPSAPAGSMWAGPAGTNTRAKDPWTMCKDPSGRPFLWDTSTGAWTYDIPVTRKAVERAPIPAAFPDGGSSTGALVSPHVAATPRQDAPWESTAPAPGYSKASNLGGAGGKSRQDNKVEISRHKTDLQSQMPIAGTFPDGSKGTKPRKEKPGGKTQRGQGGTPEMGINGHDADIMHGMGMSNGGPMTLPSPHVGAAQTRKAANGYDQEALGGMKSNRGGAGSRSSHGGSSQAQMSTVSFGADELIGADDVSGPGSIGGRGAMGGRGDVDGAGATGGRGAMGGRGATGGRGAVNGVGAMSGGGSTRGTGTSSGSGSGLGSSTIRGGGAMGGGAMSGAGATSGLGSMNGFDPMSDRDAMNGLGAMNGSGAVGGGLGAMGGPGAMGGSDGMTSAGARGGQGARNAQAGAKGGAGAMNGSKQNRGGSALPSAHMGGVDTMVGGMGSTKPIRGGALPSSAQRGGTTTSRGMSDMNDMSDMSGMGGMGGMSGIGSMGGMSGMGSMDGMGSMGGVGGMGGMRSNQRGSAFPSANMGGARTQMHSAGMVVNRSRGMRPHQEVFWEKRHDEYGREVWVHPVSGKRRYEDPYE